jgi:LAO/AO transport system kinase
VLSQAVTLIESALPEHHAIAQEVIEKCLPYSGNSVRIGITGVPGAGKSTFIEALGMYIVNQNKQLAVLAIDPSSERSKGSILEIKRVWKIFLFTKMLLYVLPHQPDL